MSKDKLRAIQMPDLSQMTDEEIETFAKKVWEDFVTEERKETEENKKEENIEETEEDA